MNYWKQITQRLHGNRVNEPTTLVLEILLVLYTKYTDAINVLLASIQGAAPATMSSPPGVSSTAFLGLFSFVSMGTTGTSVGGVVFTIVFDQ
jgi:hypothetical protein